MRWLYRLTPFSFIDWYRVWEDIRIIAIDSGTGKIEQNAFTTANDLIQLNLIRQGETNHIWSNAKLKNPGVHAIQLASLGDYDSTDDTLLIMRNGVLTDVGWGIVNEIKHMVAYASIRARAIRAKQAKAKREQNRLTNEQRKQTIKELRKAVDAKLSASTESKDEVTE